MRNLIILFMLMFLLSPSNVNKEVEQIEKVYIPEEQPQINSKTSAENNEKMWAYLWNNRVKIDIDLSKVGFIKFITEKPIKENTNIFIGLDGKTIGRLDKKSKNRVIGEPNEFIYPISGLDLVGNNNYKFKADIEKEEIFINAVVGEDNNKIEKIIVFYS